MPVLTTCELTDSFETIFQIPRHLRTNGTQDVLSRELKPKFTRTVHAVLTLYKSNRHLTTDLPITLSGVLPCIYDICQKQKIKI